MTSQQDGCTRTAASGGLLKFGSNKQPSAAPATYRLLPAAVGRK